MIIKLYKKNLLLFLIVKIFEFFHVLVTLKLELYLRLLKPKI